MWFDNASDLLPGLMPGMFGGVTFFVPDTSGTFGRRVAEYLFPGVDLPAYDDFGLYPADINVEGILLGEDYVAQATALQAAFETPGQATLVHPWWGPMTVILREPGTITFSAREINVARFSVTFTRVQPGGMSLGFATAGGVIAAVTGLAIAASAIATAADTRVISVTRSRATSRSRRVVRAAVDGLASPTGAGRFVPRLKASLPSGTASPAAFDAMMVGISGRLSARQVRPAVAPAAEAAVETPPSPSALVSVGLALCRAITVAIADAPGPTDAVLMIAAAAHVLSGTATQALAVTYGASAEAVDYRSAIFDLTATLTEAIEAQAEGTYASEMSAARRAVAALESAIAADVNETIGRLPAIKTFSPGRAIDALQLAQHIAGDRPAEIEAVYRDIVARNRPRHPAAIDGERIEVAL